MNACVSGVYVCGGRDHAYFCIHMVKTSDQFGHLLTPTVLDSEIGSPLNMKLTVSFD